jgi:lysozyme family protein
MSTLGQLKLTSATKPRHIAPVQQRRNKLAHRLWEQIQLAQSQIDGTEFVVKKYRSFKDQETGLRKQLEVPKRIRPWWFIAANGKVCISIKYGTSVLELAKGKPSVEVESPKDLVKALQTIKLAVESGELDGQIELASTNLRAGFQH